MVIKIFKNKISSIFLGNLYKIFCLWCIFLQELNLRLKFWKSHLKLFVSVDTCLYVTNLTCFESLWIRQTTSTWNDWINVLLLLLPHHRQQNNFITQLILEIKLTSYLISLCHMGCPPNFCNHIGDTDFQLQYGRAYL